MIYCTLSVGKEISENYSGDINRLATKYDVVVLTDSPEYFSKCNLIEYSRDVFSYYEKLPLLLSLVLQNKERVTYFDADSVNLIEDKNYEFDNESVYTYKIYEQKGFTEKQLRNDVGVDVMLDIYEELGYKICDYLHERILSIPYSKKVALVLEEILELQPLFEERYPKGKKWVNSNRDNIQKFSNTGCGYGEGGALSIVLKNNNIPTKTLEENRLI